LTCEIRRLRPGQEPPAPPPPPAPPEPTGSVSPTPEERACMSEVGAVAQQLARLNSGPSAGAALFARLPAHIASLRAALARLEAAYADANRSGRS
jgi:hypothetical protein